jgi:predicted nuclease of predicted toxin-antitoxin system
LRFLLDAQLPPTLAVTFRDAGHEANHVFDLGLFTTPDIEIWRYAEKTGAVIVSKDSDFATLRMQAAGGPAVVWLRLGNTTNGTLQNILQRALPEILSALETGETLIEVL